MNMKSGECEAVSKIRGVGQAIFILSLIGGMIGILGCIGGKAIQFHVNIIDYIPIYLLVGGIVGVIFGIWLIPSTKSD